MGIFEKQHVSCFDHMMTLSTYTPTCLSACAQLYKMLHIYMAQLLPTTHSPLIYDQCPAEEAVHPTSPNPYIIQSKSQTQSLASPIFQNHFTALYQNIKPPLFLIYKWSDCSIRIKEIAPHHWDRIFHTIKHTSNLNTNLLYAIAIIWLCTFNVYVCSCPCSEYTIHHTALRVDESGFVRCIVRKRGEVRNTITDLGTEELRILYSPGFTINEPYANMKLQYRN